MSSANVLYDAPGPRAQRRSLIGGLLATLLVLAAVGVVAQRLADKGQFAGKLWGPILNPSDENFAAIWGLLGKGFLATVTAAALAITFSLIIGGVVGVARMMLGRTTRVPIVAVIEVMRGLPVVITIYFASRVLPDLGVDLTGMPGGEGLWFLVIGLTAYNCVIIAEIIRAGVASLPTGQGEAALAIGLTRGAAMRLVLLPQAIRVMLPALISQIVVILKDTSLAAVLGLYVELLAQGKQIILSLHNPIQTYTVVAVIFILVNYSLSRLATWVDQRSVRKVQPKRAVVVEDA
ncbi:MAG: glutamate transport system permease protein [Actinomycetota bacterium]|jgi:glutamate transport system permease protein|nr:glutamate transport system permease protein [Actinomycetota bacterium]